MSSIKLIPNAKRHASPKSQGEHICGGEGIQGIAVLNVERQSAEKQSCVTPFSHLWNCIEEVVDEHPAVFTKEINVESGGLKNSRFQTGVYCCGTMAHHKVLSRSRNSCLEYVWHHSMSTKQLVIWLHAKWDDLDEVHQHSTHVSYFKRYSYVVIPDHSSLLNIFFLLDKLITKYLQELPRICSFWTWEKEDQIQTTQTYLKFFSEISRASPFYWKYSQRNSLYLWAPEAGPFP